MNNTAQNTKKYFGTDGFRGEAGVTLTSMHAYQIGRFLGWYYFSARSDSSRPKIVIGKDTRRSSYMFEYALVAGLTASGADAVGHLVFAAAGALYNIGSFQLPVSRTSLVSSLTRYFTFRDSHCDTS